MSIREHPLYDGWSEAFRVFKRAHERVAEELRMGNRGLIEAAKLDLKKAQEKYDEVRNRL